MNFDDQMEMQHRIFLGDFNDFFNQIEDSGKNFNFLLFVLLTIIEPLIMLNLLIALVSVVYNELMSQNTNNDFAAKNRMILEFETIQIWNRDDIEDIRTSNQHLIMVEKDETLVYEKKTIDGK